MDLHDLHGGPATVFFVGRLLLLAATVAAFLACSAPAEASPYVRYGLQDDAWLVYGPGKLDERIAELDRIGVDLVRFTINWNAVEKVRGKRELGERGLGPGGAARPGDRAGRDALRRPALGKRRSRSELGTQVGLDLRGVRLRGREALSLGEAVARLERAEPASLAASDHPADICDEAPQSRLRGNSQGDPGREGRRWRHRSTRLDRRRLPGRLDPGHGRRECAPRRVRAQPVSAEALRDALDRRLRRTARRSRWRRSSGCSARCSAPSAHSRGSG